MNEAQSDMWKRLLEGNLKTPMTWETQLSANGNNRKTWEALIESGKVGYMALLRNLRNIVAADPGNIEKVWQTIENPDAVRRSKQLPFRFLSAYKSVGTMVGSRALEALEAAASVSVENLPRLHGTTVIAVDTSGSMSSRISAKSDIACCEIAVLLGIIANRICDNSVFYTFDTNIRRIAVPRDTKILFTTTHMTNPGGGTNMDLPFVAMLREKVNADRIIILSDNECNSGYSAWSGKTLQSIANDYRNKTGNDLWIHAIDLQGYGTQQFHGHKTNIIAGWSEKVFSFIGLAEEGVGGMEKIIEAYSV